MYIDENGKELNDKATKEELEALAAKGKLTLEKLPVTQEIVDGINESFAAKYLYDLAKLTEKQEITKIIVSSSVGLSAGIGTYVLVRNETKSVGWSIFLGLMGAGIASGVSGFAYTKAVT